MNRAALRRTPVITDETLLGFAAEVGTEGPIAVEGARTRWGVGGALVPDTRLVTAPTGVVAYHPEEMTVQVRAGTTVADLHAELGGAAQRTALPDRGGTVGGAVAVGEDALGVAGVGRVRAAVLQVRYVSAEGRLVTGGGPTVKNVSGFDLPRLLVGSLGTLGLIGEVTLRTNPVPAGSVWLVADDADPFTVRDALFRPSAVLTDGTSTWIELEGHHPDIAAQRQVAAAHGTFVEIDGPPDLPPHRWSLPPSRLRHLDAEVVGRYVASIGSGTVFAERPQPEVVLDEAACDVATRAKALFDPTGRLNPGRDPAVA